MADAAQVGVGLPVAQGGGGIGAVAGVAVAEATLPGVEVGAQPGPRLPPQCGALAVGEDSGVAALASGGEGGIAGGEVTMPAFLQIVEQGGIVPECIAVQADGGAIALAVLGAEESQLGGLAWAVGPVLACQAGGE